MKKTLSLIMIGLFTFSFAGNITPTISLRVDDVMNSTGTGGMDSVTPIIGLKMGLSDGVSSGFDTETSASRIYVETLYGKLGMGTYTGAHADTGNPYFTIGGYYPVLDNMNVELEYVLNNLATNTVDVLNLSLTVNF